MDTYPSDVPMVCPRLLALIREFDARGGWANGFRSCAEWLAWRVGLAPGSAREHIRVARAPGTLPALAEALARGELSYAKARALTRIATSETEARLLAVGRADRPGPGVAWISRPKLEKPYASTRAGRCTSTRMRMAPSSSVGA